MNYFYKITKYKPLRRLNDELTFDTTEWTSFSDIESHKISIEEYMLVENAYISAVVSICNYANIEFLTITELEKYDNECVVKNNQSMSIDSVDVIVKMILREQIWCKLTSKKGEFHFGYDFYMYFISFINPIDISILNKKLYVENYVSPYWSDSKCGI